MKAFPVSFQVDAGDGKPAHHVQWGMDLRDYFAAKAMQGMLSDHTRDNSSDEIANYAYMFADAMMKVRK